jgi:hypothetical protein
MSVISMRNLSLDEDIKTYMDKLNTLKHGIQVLQNIKREKMMKIKKDIQNLCEEITGSSILCDEFTKVDPTTDLFIKRFEEFQSLLDELEHDKVIWLLFPILHQLVVGLKTPFDLIH